MSKKHNYVRCDLKDIPAGVCFSVPGRNQGQIIEVAYGGFGRAEHDDGDPYKRICDGSDASTTYYRLATTEADTMRLRAKEIAADYLAEARRLGNRPAGHVWRMALKQLDAPAGSPLAQGQEALARDIVSQHEGEQS